MSKHRVEDRTTLVRTAFKAVLTSDGDSAPGTRGEIAGLAEALTLSPTADAHLIAGSVAPSLSSDVVDLAATVVRRPIHAELKGPVQNGASEDEVLEWVLSAAIGAGRARLERGLAALEAVGGGQP